MLLKDGKASGSAQVTAVFGPGHLWADDLGYKPTPPGKTPACSNGKDDNGNGLIDFPADPGCAFADDDDENGGTYASGVSPSVEYELPKISDVRGTSGTPYPYEAVEIKTDAPQNVVITRVASDGFYVTDINATEMMNGYNSVYAFNFSTPAGVRICDRVTYLAGTANDFFGFTELSFPSYRVSFSLRDQACKTGADCASGVCTDGKCPCTVPEPTLLTPAIIANPIAMQKLESSLVRIEGFKIVDNFGPNLVDPTKNKPNADSSNCDYNGDGQIDYTTQEGVCSGLCDTASGDCSEWTNYSARAEYNVILGNAIIKIDTGTVSGFDPTAYRGQVLTAVTGTLRKFSGGTLNWTIETRCPDDLACPYPGCGAGAPISSLSACVKLRRTVDDNDEGSD
jgi:hypothetical protein